MHSFSAGMLLRILKDNELYKIIDKNIALPDFIIW